ncbi:MAG: hypothetical protein N2652_11235 [Kiritimatiellae bacterium]|nr:hypothetical protein [Kiritimatiellia bacterium]
MLSVDIRAALVQQGANVVETFDGGRIELPFRRPKPVVGFLLVGAGIVVAAFMLMWIIAPLRAALASEGSVRWVAVFFGILALPGLLLGAALIAAGVAIYQGRSRTILEVGRGHLRLTEEFLGFRHTWSRRLERIRGFSWESVGGGTSASRPPARLSGSVALLAGVVGEKPLCVAPFYPAGLLRPLAEALAQMTGRPVAGGAEAADCSDGVRGAAAIEPEPPPPVHTKVTVVEGPEGIAIDAPPAGLLRGSHGLIIFAAMWLVFWGLMAWAALAAGGGMGRMFLPVLLFGGVGVALLLWSVQLGRQRVLIAANASVLAVRRRGPLRNREERYPRTDLAAVRCGPSGIEVNKRPVMELQFHFHNRPKVGCMSHLSEEELRWLAAKLRRCLGVPEVASAWGPEGDAAAIGR